MAATEIIKQYYGLIFLGFILLIYLLYKIYKWVRGKFKKPPVIISQDKYPETKLYTNGASTEMKTEGMIQELRKQIKALEDYKPVLMDYKRQLEEDYTHKLLEVDKRKEESEHRYQILMDQLEHYQAIQRIQNGK